MSRQMHGRAIWWVELVMVGIFSVLVRTASLGGDDERPAGRGEQGDRVGQRAEELRVRAERSEGEARPREGKRARADEERLRREPPEQFRETPPLPREPFRSWERMEPEQRIRLVRQAAENLHLAGLHEIAERVAEEASRLERSQRGMAGGEERGPVLPPEMERLQSEVAELRKIIHELRERVEMLSRDRR